MLRVLVAHNKRSLPKLGASCAAASVIFVSRKGPCEEEESSSVLPKLGRHFQNILDSSSSSNNKTTTTACHGAFASPGFTLKRQPTLELLDKTANHGKTVDSVYQVQWKDPIGTGNFGNVYRGVNRQTGKPVAIKKISKRFTSDETFQREMDVLLYLEQTGGHPSLCLMHEHFDEGKYYYLVFDLIEGGELFDQLCRYGAYSEADAARTIRQTASALAFLHGVGVVHSDLKPENLMLSSESKIDSTIKIVDFGCGRLIDQSPTRDSSQQYRGTGLTPAYCPPEVLAEVQNNPSQPATIEPSFDMWSLGVIMYIMLTGAHPYDLEGGSSSEEMESNIVSPSYKLPLRGHDRTRHLSEDALTLLEGLMERDPTKRLTAADLLDKDWIRGKTASSTLITGSDSRLAEYDRHQTKIGSSIFKRLLNQAHGDGKDDAAKRTSILEIAFRDLDPNNRGYISTKELNGVTSIFAPDAKLSFSEVQQLLSENMISKYLKKGDTVCTEGRQGDSMFFLHSGSIELSSKDGFQVIRKAGDFFGEGSLTRGDRAYRNTAKCLTPVHVLEINRNYYEKYLKDRDVELTMVESDRQRQRERAKVLLGLQKNLKRKVFEKGQAIFEEGEEGNTLYILEKGKVDITVGERMVRSLKQGEMTGEHAAYYRHKPYNVTARCMSQDCTMHTLEGSQLRKLCDKNTDLSDSFKDIIWRRDFKKAVVSAIRQDFPRSEKDLKKVFDLIDKGRNGTIQFETLKQFVGQWDPSYTDEDIRCMLKSLDISNTGALGWDEFKRVFSMFNDDAS